MICVVGSAVLAIVFVRAFRLDISLSAKMPSTTMSASATKTLAKSLVLMELFTDSLPWAVCESSDQANAGHTQVIGGNRHQFVVRGVPGSGGSRKC